MVFQHEHSFIKQIIIYLQNREHEKAYQLSDEFVKKFPDSLMSHYLLAKSCYWTKRFPDALREGHAALRISTTPKDMAALGVFIACVCYELKRYTVGYELLQTLQDIKDERIEKAMFILSLCMDEPETALLHVDELYHINKETADEFVDKFLKYAKKIT